MTEKFINEAHESYILIVKSLLEKIQQKHPKKDPSKLLSEKMQEMGQLFADLGNFAMNEAFVLLGFAAAVPSAAALKTAGPAEVAPYVKGMAELFAYTLLDRIPDIIDQMTEQDRQPKQNNKVVLSS